MIEGPDTEVEPETTVFQVAPCGHVIGLPHRDYKKRSEVVCPECGQTYVAKVQVKKDMTVTELELA